jgi:hypothetical protein
MKFISILVVFIGGVLSGSAIAQETLAPRLFHERIPHSQESGVNRDKEDQAGVIEILDVSSSAIDLPSLPTSLALDERTDWVDPISSACVFDPCLGPMKRITVWNKIDPQWNLTGTPDPLKEVFAGAVERDKDLTKIFHFSASVPLTAEDKIPLPSVSPQMEIVQMNVHPPSVMLRFWKDPLDNFYVSGNHTGVIHLTGLVMAKRAYFEGDLEWLENLREPVPKARSRSADFQEPTDRILAATGIIPGTTLQKDALRALVSFFRSFEQRTLNPGEGNVLTRVVEQKTGVCRHRAFGFLLAAQACGLSARIVANETHVFVEVDLGGRDEKRWHQIDLGGGIPDTDIPEGEETMENWDTWAADIFETGAPEEDLDSRETPTIQAPALNSPKRETPVLIQFLELPPSATVGSSFSFSVVVLDLDGNPIPDWKGALSLIPMGGNPVQIDTGQSNSAGAIRWKIRVPTDQPPGHYKFRVEPLLSGN